MSSVLSNLISLIGSYSTREFKDELLSSINHHVPQMPLKSSHHPPWLNKHIKGKMNKESICTIRLRHLKHLKTGQHAYHSVKNQITTDISRSHTNYQNRLFNNQGYASKNFWKYVQNLKKDCVRVSPLKLNGKVFAQFSYLFSEHFLFY